MSALLKFRGLLAPYAGRLFLSLMLSVVTILAGVALLGVSGWFITATALAGAGAAFNIFVPSSLVRSMSFLRIAARYGEKLTGHDATLRVLSDLRSWLTAVLFPRLPLTRQSPRHGDLVGRLTGDVDALNSTLPVIAGPLLTSVVVGVAVAVMLCLLMPMTGALYALLFAAVTIVVPTVLVWSTRRLGRELSNLTADLRIRIFDAVKGHADLVVFAGQTRAVDAFGVSAERLAAVRRRIASRNALAASCLHLCTGAALLGVLWSGLGAHAVGGMSGPMLVACLLAVIGSFEAPTVLVRGLARFGTAAASAERLAELANTPPRVVDLARPVPMPDASDIRFEAVSFGYEPGALVLDRFSLAIGQGEHVVFRGPSGAGKSTLLALVPRLADPVAGRITIGGVDIRTVAQADLHSHVACLEQAAPLFLDTIRNNLAIARPATDAELWLALEAARVADWVRALPRGLDTMLAETGSSVSTGQGRRLCLARTLLSKAPILLLDEPTSGLDRKTELAFLRDLTQAAEGRTLLVVTHADLPDETGMRVVDIEPIAGEKGRRHYDFLDP